MGLFRPTWIVSALTSLLIGSAIFAHAQTTPKNPEASEEDEIKEWVDQMAQQMLREAREEQTARAKASREQTRQYWNLLSQCKSAIDEAYPPVTISSASFDLTKAIFDHHGNVSIPLKKPVNEIRAITWHTKSVPNALSFLRFLHSWHIEAVRVRPYGNLHPTRGTGLDEQKQCAAGELAGIWKRILSPCTECPVFEFVGVQPDRGR